MVKVTVDPIWDMRKKQTHCEKDGICFMGKRLGCTIAWVKACNGGGGPSFEVVLRTILRSCRAVAVWLLNCKSMSSDNKKTGK